MAEPTPEPRGPLDVAPSALSDLFRAERRGLVRLAALLVGSGAQAEEIVQEAFVAVGARWSSLENPGAYLRSTVVNGARMALRRREIEHRHRPPAPAPVDGPAELVELRFALDALPERPRTAVVLRYFAGLPDAEIAEILGCRVATVRSIVHRALRVLRKELA